MYTPKCPICNSENIIQDEVLDQIILDNEYSRTLERDISGHCADCNVVFRWVEYYVLDRIDDVYCEELGRLQREQIANETNVIVETAE